VGRLEVCLAAESTKSCLAMSVCPGIRMKVNWVDCKTVSVESNLDALRDWVTSERVL